MTLSITALGTQNYYAVANKLIILNVAMLNVIMQCRYATFHNAECRSAVLNIKCYRKYFAYFSFSFSKMGPSIKSMLLVLFFSLL
jgi:hypothetical protein